MSFFDAMSKAQIQWWLGAFEGGVLVASVVLLIGLIGEFPEHEKWREKRWYVFAKIAVIVGVLGELLFDAGLYATSSRFQVLEEADIRSAVKTAETLQSINGNMSDILARQSAALLRAQSQIADLSSVEDVLSRTLQTDEAREAKFRALVANRSLTKRQYDLIASLEGKVSAINIAIQAMCTDCSMFASQLTWPLQKAGIKVMIYFLPPGFAGTGITIRTVGQVDPTKDPVVATFMKAGLADGWSAAMMVDPSVPTDVPALVIGERRIWFASTPYFGPPAAKNSNQRK